MISAGMTVNTGSPPARYTVEHRGGCILIFGEVPVSALSVLTGLAPAKAVLDPDVARIYGANFAFGLYGDLQALRAAGAPAAERSARVSHPGLSEAAVKWLANGRRGTSSNTIFTVLTGVDALKGWGADNPHDPDDLDRCLALLEAVPELRPKLPLMAQVSPAWAALIAHWDQIERSHLDEVGLGWTKAKSAPRTYKLMRRVLDAAREAA